MSHDPSDPPGPCGATHKIRVDERHPRVRGGPEARGRRAGGLHQSPLRSPLMTSRRLIEGRHRIQGDVEPTASVSSGVDHEVGERSPARDALGTIDVVRVPPLR